ncbi:MAG TPA: universal stress protein [Spirillospora sp.]
MSTGEITEVVAGYDGSPEGIRVLDWAAAEAEVRGIPLAVVHVWQPYIGSPVAMPMLDLGAVAQQTLDGGVAHVRKKHPDVRVRGVLECGQAAARLVEAGGSAGLVVLGPRGAGGFAGLVLGSVSTQVVTHAPCPVVIARSAPDRAAEAPPGTEPGRVVAGVDGSPASLAALDMAFTEAALHGLSVHVVIAWEPAPPRDLPPLADEDVMRDAAEMQLDRMMGPLRDRHPGVAARVDVRSGPPRRVLLDASDDARLLVVGSRGLGGFRGLLLGSVSHAVVQHAPCPVAVVPAPDQDGGEQHGSA